jgi:hypothetical protein
MSKPNNTNAQPNSVQAFLLIKQARIAYNPSILKIFFLYQKHF